MTIEENQSNPSKKEFDGFIPDQIEFQLDLISKSTGFKSSSQMQNFLCYIVHKALSGQGKLLKQYTIAVEALGQPEDFDPETNPLIRIEAGRLRKKLAEYYENEGKYDCCILTIPVGRYIPKFEKNTNTKATIGCIDADDDDGSSDVESSNEIAASILASSNGWKQSCGPRLLVSCFTDQTQGEESSKLLYYVTDNLSHVMSRFLMFRLISAVPHADKNISNSVIASYRDTKLTDYILTAYIHHIKDKEYQLVAQLIEAQTQEILWSDNYSFQADEVDKQQDDICNKITAEVVDLLQGVMHVHWARKWLHKGADGIDDRYKVLAYYRHYSDNLTNETFALAVAACEQAIEKDDEDVVAQIIYSEYCRREYVYAHGVISNPLEKGLKSSQQAIRLKPESHEAHYVLGQIWFHLGNQDLCTLSFEQSRRLSHHNPQVSFGYGFHLFFMERWDEAMLLVDQVMESKVSYPDWYHMLPFLNYYRLGDYQAALIEALQIISPGVFWGPLARAIAYGQLGQTDQAKNELDELILRYPDFRTNGVSMIDRYFGNEDLLNVVCEGLEKSGLDI